MPFGLDTRAKIERRSIYLALWMVIHFQFFFESNVVWEKHPLSFPFLSEVYSFSGLLLSAYVVMGDSNRKGLKHQLFISFVFLCFMIISSLLADIYFGQPLIYGLIDTRRCLSIFSIFGFFIYTSRSKLSIHEIFTAFTLAVLIQLGISLIFQTVLSGFLIARATPSLDERKLRIANGGYLYCFYGIMCVSFFCKTGRIVYLGLILPALIGIVQITQSRYILFTFIIVCAVRVIMKYKILFLGLTTIIISLYLMLVISGDSAFGSYFGYALRKVSDKLNYTEIITAGDPIRSQTTAIILEKIYLNNYIGLGSLSLQWKEGFAPYYGKYFFLSDVGIVGEFYQVGLIYILFILSCIIYLIIIVFGSRSIIARDCATMLVLFLFITSIFGGLFFNSGHLIAAIYLISRGWTKTNLDPVMNGPLVERPVKA